MIRKFLTGLIKAILLDELKGVKSFAGGESLVGFRPIEKIRGGLFHWVAVPFNGADVFCQLRCPNAAQIEQCGDVTNIVLDESGRPKNLTAEDLIKVRNFQEALCRLVLNIPTFDEIGVLIGDGDFVIANKRKELEAVLEKYEAHKDGMTSRERNAIAAQIRTLDLELGYILPDDTVAFLTEWAMGNDVSDIKRVTREKFIQAAALAKASHKAPSDYLSGLFTDFNRTEIDAYAWNALDEHLKVQASVAKAGKMKWTGGKRG